MTEKETTKKDKGMDYSYLNIDQLIDALRNSEIIDKDGYKSYVTRHDVADALRERVREQENIIESLKSSVRCLERTVKYQR